VIDDAVSAAIGRVLDGLQGYPPEQLLAEVNHRLRGKAPQIDEVTLLDAITDADPNDPLTIKFHILLSRWDTEDDAQWTPTVDGAPTDAGTPARRACVLEILELSSGAAARIDERFPVHGSDTVVIAETSDEWTPWDAQARVKERSFYWEAYRGVLEKKLSPYAVDRLDYATDQVVRRLADPSGAKAYQSKGLVVGHVQSGKTANFAGVIAKAVDAGYRLIIVLTGTVDLLRAQTQRRLDAELVGQENILGGIDPADTDLLAEVDYAGTGDRDWLAGRFMSLGVEPRAVNRPAIRRLTGLDFDYRALKAGLTTLDFVAGNELKDPRLPLWNPANVHGTDVRLAVVKKNKAVLTKLVDDLRRLHTKLGDVPTLIIDDEADQASVNTANPNRNLPDQVARTAINRLIAQLLGLLKRGQYVGYTATPFANVFVNPDDVEDIYPRDFIISLEPPDGYMGGREFHDLDGVPDNPTFANSNELAYVRNLTANLANEPAVRAEIQAALDAYVLSGAIKLWRAAAQDVPGRFSHHTMLVHQSVKVADHDALATLVLSVWRNAGYSSAQGLRRLNDLWRDDFLPVSDARADGEPVPRDWKALEPFVGEAVDKILTGNSPVAVINGDTNSQYAQPDLDFQSHDVWKILVGGTKLSRGFTVEGLTVSYYTRRTMAADTLMQMGRWFGYRAGYRDLVRLYVGRNVAGPRGTTVDLYATFEAIVQDEEDFRDELRTFQGLNDDGTPRVRPIDVPPMVFQSLPWLRPTQAQKMYNAVLSWKGQGGRIQDYSLQPDRKARVNADHFRAVGPLLDALTQQGTFVSYHGGTIGTWDGRFGIVPADVVRSVVQQFRWADGYDFGPTASFMDQVIGEGKLVDWLVVLPQPQGVASHKIFLPKGEPDRAPLPVVTRRRRTDRSGFSGSDPRRRFALEVVAGGIDPALLATTSAGARALALLQQNDEALRLRTPTRGAMLLTLAYDTEHGFMPKPSEDLDVGDVATLFSLAFPQLSAPRGRIGFSVRVNGAGVTVTPAQVANASSQ